MLDQTVAVPSPSPVVVDTGPQVDIVQDMQVLPDMFPEMFDETDALPWSSPGVVDTGP